MRTIAHWIGGTTHSGDGARSAPVYDPATGTQEAEVVLGSPGDVGSAVAAAAAAYPEWS